MAQRSLEGITVAILATDGFEQVELTEPREALEEAGADTEVVSPRTGKVRGWKSRQWGDEVAVDQALDDADPKDYDALLLPGGVINADALRLEPRARDFVKAFFEADKPVAVICHGSWTLVDAGCVRGRTLTTWPSLKTDIGNAGGRWVDQEVVVDGNVVSSRKPDDIPAFNRELIRLFGAAKPELRRAARSGVPEHPASRP